MATSPSTHALGSLRDIARASGGRAQAKPADNAEKSKFSDVLQDARDARPEPQQRPVVDKQPRTKPVARAEKVATETPRDSASVAKKSAPAAAKPSQTGNALPPDGEELPVTETVDDLLAKLIGNADTDSQTSSTKAGKEESAAAATVDPLLSAVPIVAVMPENVAASAAAALATRGVQTGNTDEGQATAALSDATTAQKREDPTATQTLNTLAAPLSGTTPPVEATPEAVAAAVKAAADASKGDVVATNAAANTTAAVAATAATKAATDAAVAVDTELAEEGSGLSVDNQTSRKTVDSKFGDSQTAGNKTSLSLLDDGTQASGAMAGAGVLDKSTADSDGASFRDTLKQIDSTLAASSTKGSDTAPVTTARESGLRQYLDSSTAATKVDVPVGKPGWSDAVAGKVMWMSSQNLSSAEIQLNPPDLGPMSVRVSSHQDQTSVYFTSTHAQVREALDQSLPRLREMMGNQGIQLLDVGVGGQGSMRDQQAFAGNGNNGNGSSRGGGNGGDTLGDAEIGNVTRTTTTVRARPGLLDAYA